MPLPEGFTLEKQSPVSLPEGFKLEAPTQGGLSLPAGFKLEKPEPTPESQSGFRQIADVPLQVTKGAVQGVRMLTDALGADNPVSKGLRGVEDYVGDLLSAQSKKDSKEISRIMKDAEDKGVADQVLAGVKAFSVAPVDLLANVFGNAMPVIAGGLATTLLRGGAMAATAIGAGTGAAMGAGSVKGSIYDAVKEVLSTNTKLPPDQIEKRAALAQSYGGDNLDQILMGTAIGGISAATGLEGVVARQLAQKIAGRSTGNILQREAVEKATQEATKTAAKRGAYKQAAITGGAEAGTEFGQEAQEQVAQNIAQQREGFNVPTFRGAVGAGTMGALSATGLGAAAGAREGSQARRQMELEGTPEGQQIKNLDALLAQEEKQQRITELEQKPARTKQEQIEVDALKQSLAAGPALTQQTQQNMTVPPAQDELTRLKAKVDEAKARMDAAEQRFGEAPEFLVDDYEGWKATLESKLQALEPPAARKERIAREKVQKETDAERAAIQAGPIEETQLEGPEPPDIFAPAPAAQQQQTIVDPFAGTKQEAAPTTKKTDEELIAEEDAKLADQEARKNKAREIAKTNFEAAIDQVDSPEFNGDLDAALDSYRQNTLDTLAEQGERDQYVSDAADREFDKLVEEHKTKQETAKLTPEYIDNQRKFYNKQLFGNEITVDDFINEHTNELWGNVEYYSATPKKYGHPVDIAPVKNLAEARQAEAQGKTIYAIDKQPENPDLLQDLVRALEKEQLSLLKKNGHLPNNGTPKRQRWDELSKEISETKRKWVAASNREAIRGEPPAEFPAEPGALFAGEDNVTDMTARREAQLEAEEDREDADMMQGLAEMRRQNDLRTLNERVFPFLVKYELLANKIRRINAIPGSLVHGTNIEYWLRKFDDLRYQAYYGVHGNTDVYAKPSANEIPSAALSTKNAEYLLNSDGEAIADAFNSYMDETATYYDTLRTRSPREKKIKLALAAVLNNVVPFESAQYAGPKGWETAETGVKPSSSLHPDVVRAIENNDVNGALRAMAQNTSGFARELATRLAELDLPVNIVFGQQRKLFRKEIDRQTAQQQARLFSYIRQMYPDLYTKYFENFDREENLEQVMDGLREFDKGKYNKAPIEGEFKSVLKVFGELVPNMNAPGFFLPAFDVININPNPTFGTSNRVVLHEIVHAATEFALRSPDGLSKRQIEAVAELQKMYRYAKDRLPAGEYGLKSISEFVAELMTNKGFQDKLKSIKYQAKGASVFSRIVNAIMKLLGVDNLAGAAAIEVNEIFSANRPFKVFPIGPLFAKKDRNGPISNPDEWKTAERDGKNIKERISDLMSGHPDKADAIKDLKDIIFDVAGSSARKVILPVLQLRQLKDMTRGVLPQLEASVGIVEQMTAYRGNKISGPVNGDLSKSPEGITKRWSKAQGESPAQSRLMGRLMLEVTIRGIEVDPKGDGYDANKVNSALKDAWETLTPEFKEIYRDARDFYARSVQDMVQAMKDKTKGLPNVERAKLLKEIDEQFGPDKLARPYFPLRRFGDYWFQIGNGDNKEFYMFESASERRRALNDRRRELQNGNKTQQELADTVYAGQGISSIYSHNANTTTVLRNINDMVDKMTTADPAQLKGEIKDSINQLVYLLLPQQSMRKMFINRRAVQGASADMLRVFAMTSVHSAYQQARFKFAEPFMNNINNADKYIDQLPVEQQIVYRDFVRELEARAQTVLGIEDKSAWAKMAGRITESTFFFMLTAPASAMLNIIGMQAITMPYIGGKYGYAETNKLMLKNLGRYIGTTTKRTISPMMTGAFSSIEFPSITDSKDLDPIERRAAERFTQDGQWNISSTHDVFNMSEQPSAMYTGRSNTVKQALAAMFHQAERLNREVAMLTAFKLAYDKFKDSDKKDIRGVVQRDQNDNPIKLTDEEAFEAAIADAGDIAGLTLGDYTRQMKGRIFTKPGVNVLLQFKQYAITTTYVVLRNLYLALGAPFSKGEIAQFRTELEKNEDLTPEDINRKIGEMETQRKEMYKEGRRRLAGILGMAFLYGGITAMPFFSMLGPLVRMFNDDDDDDEFINWQNDFYNGMENMLGGWASSMYLNMGGDPQKVADADDFGRAMANVITRGAASSLTGTALADRVSLDLKNLWFRDGKFSPDVRESLKEEVIANLGPGIGLLFNWADGWKLFQEGQVGRAFETVAPAILSKPATAIRLGTEGATNKKGVVVGNMYAEEFSTWNLAMEALGFQTEKRAMAQKKAFQAVEYDQKVQARHDEILNRIWFDVKFGSDTLDTSLEKAAEFSAKYPGMAITPESVFNTVIKRAESDAEAEAIGARLNKKMLYKTLPMLGQ